MADPKEIGIKVEDWMGVDRQETQEKIEDNTFWSLQNLYERKLGELQRRGGSALMTATALPSNITSIDTDYVLKDKFAGKTKILKVGCSTSQAIITNANITSSFTTGGGGQWGTAPVGITNGYIGCSSDGIQLVATGFGIHAPINNPLTTNLPVSGNTKILNVTLSGSGVNNSNITGIDVYASVIGSYSGASPVTNWIWVGHIDVTGNPTGTYQFFFGPITLGADPTTADVGSSDATYTLATGSLVGTFLPGKTYYVSVLSQRVYYPAGGSGARVFWYGQSVQAITTPLNQGLQSISVSKTALGSSGSLVCIGTHPQLLRPIALMPNTATWSTVFTDPSPDSIAGVVNFVPTNANVNAGKYFFLQADFGLDEMFAKVDSNNNWQPIYINNWNGINADIDLNLTTNVPTWQPSSSVVPLTVSSGASWSGAQYFSQTQELMFLCPQSKWNSLPMNANGNIVPYAAGLTGDTVSGANTLMNVITTNLQYGMLIIGAGIPYPAFAQNAATNATQGTAIPSGATVYLVDGSGAALNATATATGTPIAFYPYVPYSPTHDLVICNGQSATMAVMDWQNAPPPQFAYLGVYQEHVMGAGGPGIARNKLFFANATTPFSWGVPGATSTVQYVTIESAGEDINGIGSYVNTVNLSGTIEQLIICKQNSLWNLTSLPAYTAGSFNNSTLLELSRKAGCANNRTIVNTEVGTIITGIDNVWLIRGMGEPAPIGDQIRYFLRAEDPNQTVDPSNWSATYHDGHYKLAYSLPGSSVPNQELWLNISKMKKMKGQPCWYGPMVGRECWSQVVEDQFNDTIIPKRWSVDRTNLRWYQADKEDVVTDFSTSLSFLLEGKNFAGQDDTINKLFKQYMWRMKVDSNFSFTETMIALNSTGQVTDANSRALTIVPGYTTSTYANFVANCRAKFFRFFPVNRGMFGENIQVQWSYTGDAYFTIAGVVIFYDPIRRRPGLSGG